MSMLDFRTCVETRSLEHCLSTETWTARLTSATVTSWNCHVSQLVLRRYMTAVVYQQCAHTSDLRLEISMDFRRSDVMRWPDATIRPNNTSTERHS